MKRMYEFVCESGHRMDKLTNYEMVEVQCVCGGLAHRVVSAPNFNLEGFFVLNYRYIIKGNYHVVNIN